MEFRIQFSMRSGWNANLEMLSCSVFAMWVLPLRGFAIWVQILFQDWVSMACLVEKSSMNLLLTVNELVFFCFTSESLILNTTCFLCWTAGYYSSVHLFLKTRLLSSLMTVFHILSGRVVISTLQCISGGNLLQGEWRLSEVWVVYKEGDFA